MEIWTPDPQRVVEKCLLARIGEIKRLLTDQGKKVSISRCRRWFGESRLSDFQEPILLPMGTVEEPFGSARLALTKLLSQMLTNGLPEVHLEVARLDLIQDLLVSLRFSDMYAFCSARHISGAVFQVQVEQFPTYQRPKRYHLRFIFSFTIRCRFEADRRHWL